MAASWPSNSDAAETKRSGLPGSGGFMLLAGKMGYRRVTRSRRTQPPPCHARRDREIEDPQADSRSRRLALGGAPPARRRRTRSSARRSSLLRRGRFRERGYHNTSLDDLAASLKVTKPTLYLYVPEQGSHPVRVLPGGPRARSRPRSTNARAPPGPARERLFAFIRGYAAAIVGDFGWCMLRAEDQHLGAAMSRRIKLLKARHRPAHARAHRGRRRRRLDPRLRHEA